MTILDQILRIARLRDAIASVIHANTNVQSDSVRTLRDIVEFTDMYVSGTPIDFDSLRTTGVGRISDLVDAMRTKLNDGGYGYRFGNLQDISENYYRIFENQGLGTWNSIMVKIEGMRKEGAVTLSDYVFQMSNFIFTSSNDDEQGSLISKDLYRGQIYSEKFGAYTWDQSSGPSENINYSIPDEEEMDKIFDGNVKTKLCFLIHGKEVGGQDHIISSQFPLYMMFYYGDDAESGWDGFGWFTANDSEDYPNRTPYKYSVYLGYFNDADDAMNYESTGWRSIKSVDEDPDIGHSNYELIELYGNPTHDCTIYGPCDDEDPCDWCGGDCDGGDVCPDDEDPCDCYGVECDVDRGCEYDEDPCYDDGCEDDEDPCDDDRKNDEDWL